MNILHSYLLEQRSKADISEVDIPEKKLRLTSGFRYDRWEHMHPGGNMTEKVTRANHLAKSRDTVKSVRGFCEDRFKGR